MLLQVQLRLNGSGTYSSCMKSMSFFSGSKYIVWIGQLLVGVAEKHINKSQSAKFDTKPTSAIGLWYLQHNMTITITNTIQ